jgi:phage host-nuclease inhibitor protein Gam
MTQGDQQDITIGEIARSVQRIEASIATLQADVQARHHALNNKLNDTFAPIVNRHTVQIENQQKNLDRLNDDMDDVTKQANRIAGAGAILAVVVGLIPWPWKR